MIFSASIAPANATSVIGTLDLIQSNPSIIDNLWDNTRYALQALKNAGFDTGHSMVTPIIPLLIRDDFQDLQLTKMALENGVLSILFNITGGSNTSSLIYSLMATHTKEQIDRSVEVLEFPLLEKISVFDNPSVL